MPIHIGDYKRDTGHLRAAEHGAYLLLLFHHWSTGALPDDDRQLSAIACMSPAEWKRAKPILVKFFKPGWVHGRVVDDLEEANAAYERRAKAGRESGKARSKNEQCSNNAPAMLQQPITDNQKEDRIGDAGAKPSGFTVGSKALADSLWKALGIENALQVPPELAGADWRALEWERAGWTVDLIGAEARRVGPGKPLIYYEKCFATSFAKRQAPLPIVEVKEAEKLTVTNGTNQNRSGGSLTASLRRELAEIEQPEGNDFALPDGSIRLLSN
jgi:uncharacterized protein YdaU (DUF1376 family)